MSSIKKTNLQVIKLQLMVFMIQVHHFDNLNKCDMSDTSPAFICNFVNKWKQPAYQSCATMYKFINLAQDTKSNY